MPRMLEMVRNSQVPSNLMQAAARGALSVAPAEMIEILVHLALHNKVFSAQARMTLAGWDEKASLEAAADPRTSAEVLSYFLASENLRSALLPALIENPSVPEKKLADLASSGSRDIAEALLKSERARNSATLSAALRSNANLRTNELDEIEARLAPLYPAPAAATPAEDESDSAHDEEAERTVTQYLVENAAELAAEASKPFQDIGASHEAGDSVAALPAGAVETSPAPAEDSAGAAAAPAPAASTKPDPPKPAAPTVAPKKPGHAPPHGHQEKRDSTLQKIAKLDVKGRINLAVRGSKEERSILIRDATKLVAIAVLESPKVSDTEVEGFALQKNVLEAVLRQIPMKRRYAKNYAIMRNLVYNPRTPLDISLGLMKNLLIHDLKNLSGNKEVSDTIRKLALRMFKQKTEKKKE